MADRCRRCGSTHVSDTLFRTPGGLGVFRVEPRDGREQVLAPLELPAVDPEAARLELTRRFLRAYGPATPADLAGWTNTGVVEARRRFAALAGELTGDGLLAEDAAAPARARTPTGVRLLAAGDPYLQSRDRATLVPDPGVRTRLWPATAAPGAVLVDGEVVATWRARRKKDVLELTVTGPTPPLEQEAELLAAARGCGSVTFT
jgi:hypothetical protein